ncbi:MAG: SDR family NAD(P)-dependent oxidoreductase [Cyanobacteria bacterium P01_A01_bin.17]
MKTNVSQTPTKRSTTAIAVVGMGCHYPGASEISQLWENIVATRQQFRRSLDQRLPIADYYDPDPAAPDKTYGSRMALIDGFEFDWVQRRIPKTVIESADIAQWLALDVAIKAAQDAGYTRDNIPTERTGVLLGNTLTGEFSRSTNMRMRWPYVRRALIAASKAKGLTTEAIDSLAETMEIYYKSVFFPITEDTLSGNLSNTIAGRICNFFDFHGGGYTVDGACSSSLIAVANAATALANGDLDLAFAGGVDISLDTFELIGFAKTNALTGSDMTVYDRKASGMIPGEGAGFVVLKRLEDARASNDYVYGVLNGWGISSDGKGGITAPSSQGQAAALRRAYERAGYSPHTLDFIEGHGTGTVVGDRTELSGIALAMESDGTPEPRACGVTSFKSIVGHTKAAAGIGAFIKATMAVNRRVLPPVAGCHEPNLVFENTARCLYPIIRGEIRDPQTSLRAGISAMGFGGINCHVTIESGDAPAPQLQPTIEEQALLASNQETELFVFAADSIPALVEQVKGAISMVRDLSIAELTDWAAHLSQQLRPQQVLRGAVIASQPTELVGRLEQLVSLLEQTPPAVGNIATSPQRDIWVGNGVQQNRVGFLFPGQGSQKLEMARVLVARYAWARDLVEQAETWLSEIGFPGIRDAIYVPLDRVADQAQFNQWSQALAQTEIAQPAICLASLLWMRYLKSLGISPDAVAGHSLGELTAFCGAGAIDEKTLLCLAAIRGKAMVAAADGAKETCKGTMASLGCDQSTAAALIAQVDGYVIPANLNSPSQTVISGEQASVEAVIGLATAKGIQVRQLPVSNAFHSRLVAPAAEQLRHHELIPETLDAIETPLFSSTHGQQIQPGLLLREHFANQILEQVDFIALVETLQQRCDLLIEVGPGKVLSNLANTICDRLVCLPVESKTGLDADLNAVLAAMFVRGQQISWENLYQNRLVRPFVPSSARVFIENPIEKPFQISPEQVSPMPAEPNSVSPSVNSQEQVSWDLLSTYISQRGKFLTEIIKADVQSLPLMPPLSHGNGSGYSNGNGNGNGNGSGYSNGNGSSNGNGHGASNGSMPSLLPPSQPPVQQEATRPAETVEDFLVTFIVQQTGFPRNSINLTTKLLDDLNLDSIKEGEVIAAVTQTFNVAGKVDPASMANATIQEIAEAIRLEMPQGTGVPQTQAGSSVGSQTGSQTTSVEDFLVTFIVQQTGFPRDSVTLDTKLLDDLNLDSIKAGEVIAAATQTFAVAGKVDPASMANATIQEIAEAIRLEMPQGGSVSVSSGGSALTQAPPAVGVTPSAKTPVQTAEPVQPARVRDYIVQTVAEASSPVSFGQHPEADWPTAHAVILHEPGDREVAQGIEAALHRQGAQVQALLFEEAQVREVVERNDLTHFVAILPQAPESATSTDERLSKMIARLRSVATLAPGTAQRHKTVAYVQFGGGHFGSRPPFTAVEQCCSIGFACSLHLERPDLKVRVIDFSTEIQPADLAERVVQEMTTQHAYLAAGYDADRVRYVPMPQVQEPVDYQARDIGWTADDVVLVTGGAKGITAECAFTLAKATGVRMALVGRSPVPDRNTPQGAKSEVIRTLDRFSEHGLICQVYSCDVTDFQALSALVAQIEQSLGKVTGLIHGAALNRPRLISQVSTEEALTEVKPKLKGLLNLCQIFETRSLKLFAGFSSVIGVTGMQRNAWYGFANESLDLILRRFKAQHPETAVVSTAYSVWEEVGMGARMGSVRSLAKMGIQAIPKAEGAARFLHLMTHEPADQRVVIAAPMQALSAFESAGLDTWLPRKCAPPSDLKFLEEVLLWEENVEILARTHLSLEKDAYLLDHCYKGSYLFPTVFGLEAMAQAVAYVTNTEQFPVLHIEDVRLDRPIVVDKDRPLEIEIHAEVLERAFRGAPQRVCVTIKTAKTGFAIAHFSAIFVLGTETTSSSEPMTLPSQPLDIQPQRDLYSWLLFQGPRFQRLSKIYQLDSQSCTFETQRDFAFPSDAQSDSERLHGIFLLGDPYYRDTLLQAGQLVIPQDNCLPIRIDRIEIYQPQIADQESCLCVTVPQGREGKQFSNQVSAMTPDGQLLERLSGYHVQLLAHRSDYPTAEELANPQARDQDRMRREICDRTRLFNVSTPAVSLKYSPDLGSLSPAERHAQELPIFRHAISQLLDGNLERADKIQLHWTSAGKPEVDGSEVDGPEAEGTDDDAIAVSLTHDAQICLCVAGRAPQGCDIEPVTPRAQADWTALLGNARQPMFSQLVEANDSEALAGTRIWTAIEALQKATGTQTVSFAINRIETDTVLFQETASETAPLQVLTFPIRLTRGLERMVAVVVQPLQTAPPAVASTSGQDFAQSVR